MGIEKIKNEGIGWPASYYAKIGSDIDMLSASVAAPMLSGIKEQTL